MRYSQITDFENDFVMTVFRIAEFAGKRRYVCPVIKVSYDYTKIRVHASRTCNRV